MRLVLVVILLLLVLPIGTGRAEVVFSLVPSSTSIELGSSATVDVFMRSTTSGTVGGFSANVIAGSVNGVGGRFTSGTFEFLIGDPKQSWDTNSTVGHAFATADTSSAGGTGAGRAIAADTNVRLGTLTFSTAGASIGNYQFNTSSLSAIQLNGSFFPGGVNGASFSGPVAYSITAVPEPTSIALLCAGGLSITLYRIRKPKQFRRS